MGMCILCTVYNFVCLFYISDRGIIGKKNIKRRKQYNRKHQAYVLNLSGMPQLHLCDILTKYSKHMKHTKIRHSLLAGLGSTVMHQGYLRTHEKQTNQKGKDLSFFLLTYHLGTLPIMLLNSINIYPIRDD